MMVGSWKTILSHWEGKLFKGHVSLRDGNHSFCGNKITCTTKNRGVLVRLVLKNFHARFWVFFCGNLRDLYWIYWMKLTFLEDTTQIFHEKKTMELVGEEELVFNNHTHTHLYKNDKLTMETAPQLVGGWTNPSPKYWSNWIISPRFGVIFFLERNNICQTSSFWVVPC